MELELEPLFKAVEPSLDASIPSIGQYEVHACCELSQRERSLLTAHERAIDELRRYLVINPRPLT